VTGTRLPMGRIQVLGPLFLSLILVLILVPAATAQQGLEADSLRARFLLPVPPPPESVLAAFRPTPAMSASSPTGFGAQWGDLFAGVSYQTRARNVSGNDGAVGAGFGLGNAQSLIGFEVAVVSFSTLRSGWGERVGVDLKLHRVLPGAFGVALGWESALLRGRTDGMRSRYLAVSRWFQLRPGNAPLSAVLVTGGIGNDRFVRPADWVRGRNVGLFGSVGVRVLEPVSLVVDWTGQDLGVAASVAPFGTHWLVFSAGFMDLTGSAGDGARLVLSGSYLVRMVDF